MRRRIKKLAEKVLDISRPSSPVQGSSTAESDHKPDASTQIVKKDLGEGLRVLKEVRTSMQHGSLVGPVTKLIKLTESVDFAIDNTVLERFSDELIKLSDALRTVKSDRPSLEIEKQAESLARNIDNAINKANASISTDSSKQQAGHFTNTTALVTLCDDIRAATQNFLSPTRVVLEPRARSTARDVSGRVVGALAIVHESLDGVPVVGLKGAIGGFLEALKAINRVIDNDDDVLKLIDHVQRLVKIVTPSATDEFNTACQKRVDELVNDIQIITAEAERLQNQSLGSKFTGSTDNANVVLGLVMSIDRAIDRFQVAGSIWVERNIGQLSAGIGKLDMGMERVEEGMGFVGDKLVKVEAHLERIGTTAKNTDDEAALNAIQPRANNARYNSASQTSSSFCLPNTRVEILSEILQWVNNAQDDRP
ncbi:hypothetical protein FRC02_010151, partial [Tulasnella sp. 418]